MRLPCPCALDAECCRLWSAYGSRVCRRSVQYMVDHQEQYMFNEVPAHMTNGTANGGTAEPATAMVS